MVTLLGEILTTPPTTDAHLAMQWIIGKPMGRWFWRGGLAAGHVLPLILLWSGVGAIAARCSRWLDCSSSNGSGCSRRSRCR